MLMNAENSSLLVVDVQDRLLPHIHNWQTVLDNSLWLVRVAQRMGVPVMATEQYPKGLGYTHADLRQLLPPASIAEKLHFSCVSAQCLPQLPGFDRPQVVVCGIEAHVCVLQTVLDLRAAGKAVFVVADAIGSRDPASKTLAIERMRMHGIEIVGREMVAFEWLHEAGTAVFREISKEFLR